MGRVKLVVVNHTGRWDHFLAAGVAHYGRAATISTSLSLSLSSISMMMVMVNFSKIKKSKKKKSNLLSIAIYCPRVRHQLINIPAAGTTDSTCLLSPFSFASTIELIKVAALFHRYDHFPYR